MSFLFPFSFPFFNSVETLFRDFLTTLWRQKDFEVPLLSVLIGFRLMSNKLFGSELLPNGYMKRLRLIDFSPNITSHDGLLEGSEKLRHSKSK